MKTYELVIDNEADDMLGVNAISLVTAPAIESDFVAFSKTEPFKAKFEAVNNEKRIVMGAALIPNKLIYRRRGDGEEFNVFLSAETINQASQLFLKRGFHNRATLEHQERVDGVTVVESWIVEDSKIDKSAVHGMNHPIGTWMISMKIFNEEVWTDFVKTGILKGFSIEGYFTELETKVTEMSKVNEDEEFLKELFEVLESIK